MNKIMIALVAFGAALLLGVAVFAQQQSQSGTSQKQGAQSMSMDDMMKGCKDHCQKTMSSIDQTTATMKQARESNDPAQMRSALEQGEKSLAEMKNDMSSCMSMMNMMGNMDMKNMNMNKPRKKP